MQTFDHIILGSGQATGTLLGKLIATGDSIAVIEGGKVGGTCVNYGCTPTKTLVASAKAIYVAKRGEFFGFETGEIKVNFARIRERMNDIRNGSSNGLTNWMESTPNVTLIRGWGKFEGAKTIRVGDDLVEGKHIYINVGTSSFTPPINGLDDVEWIDNSGLLDLEEIPKKLIIVGGGYIGVEFAQVFNRFGSEVTLIQRDDQLMPREDADVANSVQHFLEEEGISVLLNANTNSVSQNGTEISVELEVDGKEEVVTGTKLLLAIGRRPNTSQLNLDAAGINTNERGFISVDDYCRTSVGGVFAVGDVNGRGAFTHTSVNDAEIVLDHLFDGDRKLSERNQVYGLFTDPPLGRVGMSEKEALASGKRVLKATRTMTRISRAKEMGETNGFVKFLVDADTDLFLGASILGVGGDEVINMFATAMQAGMTWKEYRKTVLVHPTVSELMPWTLDALKEI